MKITTKKRVGFNLKIFVFALLKTVHCRAERNPGRIGRLFNCNDRCFFIWREAPKPKCLPGLVSPIIGCLHLHGQTGWSTVWANGHKSGLEKFGPESRLPFVQISSIYRKRPRRPETSLNLKVALKKWNTNFRLEYSVRKNRPTFSDVRYSRKFSDGTTQKVVFHFLTNRIFRKLFVNGKQPEKLRTTEFQ